MDSFTQLLKNHWWFSIAKCKKMALKSQCGSHVKMDWRVRILEAKKDFRSRYFQNRICMRGGLLITPRPPKSNQMLSFIFMNTNVPNSDKLTCIIEEHVTPDSTETFFSDFAFFLVCYKLYETYIVKQFTVMYLLTM